MSGLRFYNRYTSRLEEEEIYGEKPLRWVYETLLGKLSLWALVRRPIVSAWYGWRMNKPKSCERIKPFIEQYELDTWEFAADVESYSSFNDFFFRKLKSEARPLCEGDTVALPADGRHMGIAELEREAGVYVKGQRLDLRSLLGSGSLAETFAGGVCVISRLCPVDYHRFHSPVSGKIVSQRLINGDLFSVSPIALGKRIEYLWENKRLLTVIESAEYGLVAYLAIGATMVGSIKMTKRKGETVEKGEEMGYFEFGGSCVMTLFEAGKLELTEDLKAKGAEQLEVYAKVGDVLGRRK
ncbi:MAG: archaetidylserine decarboxylase [Verrucomicrobiota bacterium]